MADWTNIARPYAKAVFGHALKNKELSLWSEWLSKLNAVMSCPAMLDFIENPETTTELHAKAISLVMQALPGLSDKLPEALDAFIQIVAENRRLPVVSAIFEQFEALRADEEHRVSVQVSSFSPLSTAQQERLIERLTKRLNRKVELQLSVDPELLGGAVISAKDWVINASVKGQLEKLGAELDASSRG